MTVNTKAWRKALKHFAVNVHLMYLESFCHSIRDSVDVYTRSVATFIGDSIIGWTMTLVVLFIDRQKHEYYDRMT